MKFILYFLIFFIFNANVYSQINKKLLNSWKIDNYSIFNKNTKKNISGEELQSYPFFDVFSESTSLKISKDGKLYMYYNQENNINYKIKGNEFYIYFAESNHKQSYIVYEFKLENQKLTLYREDPLIKESYSFTIN